MKAKYIIFDLDDTLMHEIDFLKSAYKEIAIKLDKDNPEELYYLMISKYEKGDNVFEFLTQIHPEHSKKDLLVVYRNHFPNLTLNDGAEDLLNEVKARGHKIGLITDGRSITQRNKLKALKIENSFDKIVVSEEFGSTKPDERNFKTFIDKELNEYVYVADNTNKDFITPNKLGWTSICLLDNGKNIHKQNFGLEKQFLPKFKVTSLHEAKKII